VALSCLSRPVEFSSLVNIASPPPTSSRLSSSTILPASKFPASSLLCCCCCWRNYCYRRYSLAEPPRRGGFFFFFIRAFDRQTLSRYKGQNGQPVARFLCCVVRRRTTNDRSFRTSARNRAQFGIVTYSPPPERGVCRIYTIPSLSF
jgi:hypothetical protein